jgi:NAD(P)-dependent dehydrogenase (short-subunit alcohol dehydrogenase family)
MIRSFTTAPLFADETTMRKFAYSVPMQRGGEPEEIAAAACFLASPQSSYTTGCIVTVDGGRLLHAKPKSLSGALAANKKDGSRGLG